MTFVLRVMRPRPYVTTDAAGYTVHTCPTCGGSSHPATGCAYSQTFVVCWACTLDAARWVQRWTAQKGKRGKGHVGGINFYDAAGRKP